MNLLKQINYFQIILLVVYAISLLLVKDNHFDFSLNKYLWAEDGIIFLDSAHRFGLEAIFIPYNGYIHLYPRIVAEIANFFTLESQRIMMFLGWAASYIICVLCFIRFLWNNRINLLFSFLSISFLILQPHSGECFFNATNAQWWLAFSLIIVILDAIPKHPFMKFLNVSLVAVCGLTGPFSVVFFPVALLKFIVDNFAVRDYLPFKHNLKNFYSCLFYKSNENKADKIYSVAITVVLAICALVQVVMILKSERIQAETISSIKPFVESFVHFLLFCTSDIMMFPAMLMWNIAIVGFPAFIKNNQNNSKVFTVLCILIAATCLIFVSLYSVKSNPAMIVFNNSGNRYSFVPNILIFTAGLIILQHCRKLLITYVILGVAICYCNFSRPHLNSLDFEAYTLYASTKYESTKEKFSIPINPEGWMVSIDNAELPKTNTLVLPVDEFANTTDYRKEILVGCPEDYSDAIAITFNLENSEPVTLNLRYAPVNSKKAKTARFSFSSNISEERVFAFSLNQTEYNIRFYSDQNKDFALKNVKKYCMSKSANSTNDVVIVK